MKTNQAGNANYSAAAHGHRIGERNTGQPDDRSHDAGTGIRSQDLQLHGGGQRHFRAADHLHVVRASARTYRRLYTMTANSGTCTERMNAPSSANYTAAPQVIETTAGAPAVAPIGKPDGRTGDSERRGDVPDDGIVERDRSSEHSGDLDDDASGLLGGRRHNEREQRLGDGDDADWNGDVPD